ncbi:MAG: hypothetical protein A4E65_03252 [Syntrophorhabdus sp. PtaU1.Bin153]|nr:MAG: hypothetical protein A4E65_03252 [Syntrophorhabdus sp. PtaU1.Bin153]
MFIFRIPDSSVKETDIDMFIRHSFNVFIFRINRDRPEKNVSHLIYDKKLIPQFYHGNLTPTARGSPVESQFELLVFGHI